jgi:uncharacterized protein YbjT (DUF2867 family)
MRVAVAGGTGTVGRPVVAELAKAGHEPVVLARSEGVDLTSGAGLADRIAGCDAIIDVTNRMTTSRATSTAFFTQVTGNLVAAAEQAGAGHLIVLSIVGVDRVGYGYYQGKRAQEKLLEGGGVPWSVLRATQFFDLPRALIAHRFPIAAMPRMLSQPVDTTDVATALVDLVEAGPSGYATPVAGPERLRMADMARRIERVLGSRRPVLAIPVPGKVGRQLATGGLVPDGEYMQGKRTFDEYLATLR